MATFKIEVEDYIGTFSDTDALDAWLTHAARLIMHLLPDNKAEKFTQVLTDAGSGISIEDYRPLWAHKSGYKAIKFSASMKARLTLSGSMFEATTTSPYWYVELLKGYVVPSGGSIVVVSLPIVVNTMSSINLFPNEYKHGVVLYAAIQGIIQQLNVLSQTTLGGISFTFPTQPTTASAPAFTFTSPSFGGSYTKIETALTNKDPELAAAEGGELNLQLQEYATDIQDQLGVYRELVDEYQGTLGKFNADLASYAAQVTEEVQRVQTLIQQRTTQHGAMQTQLTAMKEEYKQILELVQKG